MAGTPQDTASRLTQRLVKTAAKLVSPFFRSGHSCRLRTQPQQANLAAFIYRIAMMVQLAMQNRTQATDAATYAAFLVAVGQGY